MKALVYGGPGKRSWEEVPKPRVVIADFDGHREATAGLVKR